MQHVDYCQYCFRDDEGHLEKYPYKKPTALWTNLSGWEAKRCQCKGRRHASSLIGDRARGA
eukprot:3334860-Prymnesium_polylepis.3